MNIKTIALKKSLKSSWIFPLAAVACLFAIYIVQVGALASDRQLVRNYERELDSLAKDTKFLDIDFSKMNSLSRVEEVLARNSGFVKTDNVKYIQIVEGSVVIR